MRALWLITLLLTGCVPQPENRVAGTSEDHFVRLPPASPDPRDTDNCGTPHKFKLCGTIWKPAPRYPIYVEQMEDIPGNIGISDMPSVIVKAANP